MLVEISASHPAADDLEPTTPHQLETRSPIEPDVAAKVSPHWLRHAHASHSLDKGAPLHLVQATLGHTSISATSVYLHVHPMDSTCRFIMT